MKHIKSFILKSRYIWLGIKSIFKLNLGDRVIYQGRVCGLYQGVYNPKWHLRDIETLECLKYVHRDNFKKIISAFLPGSKLPIVSARSTAAAPLIVRAVITSSIVIPI